MKQLTRSEKAENDIELVSRVREGDKDALAELIEQYQKRVLSVAFKMTGNWHTAQDIAQDVFISLVEKLHTFNEKRNFFSWVYRITVNKAIDFLRKSERETMVGEIGDVAPKTETTSEDILIKAEMREKVRKTISELPLKYRTVLTLRDIEGLSTVKIAEILDIDPATARWRVFQARKLFRGLWEKKGV